MRRHDRRRRDRHRGDRRACCFSEAADQEKDGWKGAARTFLWNSGPIQFTETSKFKKNPPWTIAVANASISNVWAVGWLHSLQYVAAKHKDVIKQLIVTDANDDLNKQVADIQDLLQRKPDLLIVRPATAQALDPACHRAMKSGVPVVLSDRSITSDNYISLVNADDWSLGRIWRNGLPKPSRAKAILS